MKTLLSGATVYRNGGFERRDILIAGGMIEDILPPLSQCQGARAVDVSDFYILPGFADVHVHLREPGFSYKETIATGTAAAAAGGYTAVCPMPNLNPPPDSVENLACQLEIIGRHAVIPTLPYASITVGQRGEGELVDFDALAPLAFGFSDDGKGVQDEALMQRAMEGIRSAGSFLAAHVEDEALLNGGYIHDGPYAAAHGHRGICAKSEWGQLARDLRLVKKTGCPYHMCHVSTKESVELIRRAKADGLPVTCETAPHYLILCDEDLQEDGRFKMNPPLRQAADRQALIDGIKDGTIDMIATDHAPHSAQEKAGGLAASAMGIVGLETAFPLLYTCLVEKGVITLARLVDLMALAPRRVFGRLPGGPIEAGRAADLVVADLGEEYTIDPGQFKTMGRATPFAGWTVRGRIKTTVSGGDTV